MFYINAASQLSLLAGLCFPFCIIMSALWFKNADRLPRLLGLAFWAPLLMNAASFMASSSSVARSLAALSEPALLLLAAGLLLLKPVKRYFGVAQATLWLFPLLVLAGVNGMPAIRNFLSEKINVLSLLIILLLLNLYLLKIEKGPESMLFWNMLLMAAGGAAAMLPEGTPLLYLVPAIKLAVYSYFTVYFYRAFLDGLQTRVGETEKRLAAFDRSIEYEVRKRVLEIEKVNKNLINLSRTDSLSSALNKAAVLDFIEKLILTKPGREFSVLIVDIDDFKTINDTFGHVVGDKCIKTLSVAAKSHLGEDDVLGRYGGDEFLIILPGVNTTQALAAAERFRKRIDATQSPHFTISAGVSTYPGDGVTARELIEAADEGLYSSKARGKNAVSYKGGG